MSQDSNDQPTQPVEIPPTDGRSRRDFLKVAVIGSAAVAAAGGVATAGLALTGKKPAIVPFVGDVVSGGACQACVTSSAPDATDALNFNIDSMGHAKNPGDFYLWFSDTGLAAGTYSLSVSITKEGDGTATLDSGTFFDYQGGNSVKLYRPAQVVQCPTSIPNASDVKKSGDTIGDVFPYSHPGGNLLVSIHMDYTGGTIGPSGTTKTFTFTVTLSSDGQQVCQSTYVITGHQQ
jgi:hypothetical protein